MAPSTRRTGAENAQMLKRRGAVPGTLPGVVRTRPAGTQAQIAAAYAQQAEDVLLRRRGAIKKPEGRHGSKTIGESSKTSPAKNGSSSSPKASLDFGSPNVPEAVGPVKKGIAESWVVRLRAAEAEIGEWAHYKMFKDEKRYKDGLKSLKSAISHFEKLAIDGF